MERRQELTDDKLVKITNDLDDIQISMQQQISLLSDRVTRCESELKIYRRAYDIVCERVAAHAIESFDNVTIMQSTLDSTERDYSGLKFLTIFACSLSVISIVGVVLCVLYL